ncbi:MAG: WbuC family cupin fold metalloprotein [Tannerella sp.]|jgi:cupin fold WbuC family metalloprotein|nr:WbuC family cupin fold metalloprotein [Tannerella sp.]
MTNFQNGVRIIDASLLDETTARAKRSPRLRMNFNFHEDLNDPLNRLLNAMEPGTYLRPHRHCNPDRHEIFLLLRGRVALFLFDGAGNIADLVMLDPLRGCYGGEIPAGVWHGLLVLETGTVLYEIKQGPFAPLTPDNLAPWSPPADDAGAVRRYMEELYAHLP